MKNNKGVVRLQAPFEKIKQNTKDPVERLYRAVIMQMIIDASNNSDSKMLIQREKDAKKWLFDDNSNMDWSCKMANIDKNLVRQIARKIIDKNNKGNEGI